MSHSPASAQANNVQTTGTTSATAAQPSSDAGEPSAVAPIVDAVTAPVRATAAVAKSVGTGLDALIARHAAAHNVPPELVRRVVMRESRGNPRAVSKGNYGIMQIRLGTARALGYRGDAAGLLDADTNMTYAVKYLAGAYRVAGGSHDRAVALYARGYYYEAKRQGVNAYAAAAPAAPSLLPVSETPPAGAAAVSAGVRAATVDPYNGRTDTQ